ncbi:DciA family protein [Streptomyces sp. NPDC054865]
MTDPDNHPAQANITALDTTLSDHPAQQAPDDSSAPTSGPDLAKIALRHAMDNARKNPVRKLRPKRNRRGSTRADGRDPVLLVGVIDQVRVDNEWDREAAGADLKDKWPSLIGETRAAHWQADSFDEETGTLRVVCDSAPWAANLRLMEKQVVTEVGRKFDQLTARGNVKRITSPLRNIDVRIRSGRTTSTDLTAETTSVAPPTPVLREERRHQPNAEYRALRARQAQERADRIAAGEPGCPPPPRFAPDPILRTGAGDEPSTAYRQQRDRVRRARAATHDQALAVARGEASRSQPQAGASYAYAS